MFKEFCQQIGMKVAFVSVYHPQSNGAVEKANSLIFKAMKKILEGEKKGKWAEVMSTAVWSYNTTVCRGINFTSFRLMYGAEAMLPEENTEACESQQQRVHVLVKRRRDLLESDRLKAVTNIEKYEEETRAWKNPKVKLKQIEVENLMLLRSPRTKNTGKFEAKWIGPYMASEKTRPGAYRLSDTQGRVLEHS
jgi:hypothetical protein